MKTLKIRQPYLVTGISLVIFYLILNFNYRPFVYENHLMDYHLADTLGSLFSIPVCTFILFSFISTPSAKQSIFIQFVLHLFIETSSIVLPTGTFDFYDVIALSIGTLFSVLIIRCADSQELLLIPLPKA